MKRDLIVIRRFVIAFGTSVFHIRPTAHARPGRKRGCAVQSASAASSLSCKICGVGLNAAPYPWYRKVTAHTLHSGREPVYEDTGSTNLSDPTTLLSHGRHLQSGIRVKFRGNTLKATSIRAACQRIQNKTAVVLAVARSACMILFQVNE